MKVSTPVNKALKKVTKEAQLKLEKLLSGKDIQIKGTPPGDINPFDDPEWWDICRDEIAFGEPHPGIAGCFTCATMCASDPSATGRELECWTSGLFLECIIPEITDLFNTIIPREPSCEFEDIMGDPNKFRSSTCLDSTACIVECPTKCKEEEYNDGSCEKVGDDWFCTCS